MKARYVCVAAMLVVAATLHSVGAQPMEVRAAVRPERPRANEAFALIVTVASGASSSGTMVLSAPSVAWPDFAGLGLEQLPGSGSSTRMTSVNGRTQLVAEVQVQLRAARPGRYEIPPLEVTQPGASGRTGPLVIEVGAAGAGSGGPYPGPSGVVRRRAIPLAAPDTSRWLRTVGIAAAITLVTGAVIVAAVVLGLRARGAEGRESEPARPGDAAEQTYARLQRLARQADAGPFYSALDAWLRRTLSRCYGVESTGLTSAELLRACREAQPAEATSLDAAAECLATAERVKFAAYAPTTEEMQQHLALTWGVVHRCGAQGLYGGQDRAP